MILIHAWVYFYVFLPANDHYNLMAAWENTDGSRNVAVQGAALTQLPPLPPPHSMDLSRKALKYSFCVRNKTKPLEMSSKK